MTPSFRQFHAPGHQRGAVLYIALMLLILLSLLGIVGMQVASMQEKMSSNYRAVNVAFQAGEQAVRDTERSIEALDNNTGDAGSLTAEDIQRLCDDGYDPTRWANEQTLANAPVVNVRRIEACIQGEASLEMGMPESEEPTRVYQITAYASDRDDDNNNEGTSSAAIDTVFKL
ncbi:PilX N-terminal domain-containing pilus assembly protein [Stenotrophomonas sp. PFBMAA-4]|uniref:pilus assembly PilX family protein n=1 Tax=Stenotrophomonas sp. PFBMAA-4 TaxID=3043301 RepID=UPI0024B6114A|nr:PilX N-terminal domain-containing pilus assembly protein [Stenotrophomonas sp. PFBMAA-4]MDI9274884.1 PilX N-terminal domain-containing pilus assembly protein [Stenotrophomonas sp. PFBMAA-4]